MHKTVLFDLGNVLLFFDHSRMCEQIGRCLDLKAETIHKVLFQDGLGDLYERGEIHTVALYEYLCNLSPASQKPNYQHFLEAAGNIFTPNLSLLPLLEELKKQNHRLLVVSNTNAAHFLFARQHYPQILDLFDDYILSYEIGASKPEERIFLHALEKAQCPREHCFFTDDIPLFIEGATRVGIPCALFEGPQILEQHLKQRGFL